MFVTDSSAIANRNLFVSAGRFNYQLRRFALAQCHRNNYDHNPKLQLLFKAGTKNHERIQEPYQTIEEMGYENYRKLLYQNKKVALKELGVLSIKEKMFGYMDLFEIQWEKDGTLNVWITDFKSSSFRSKNHFTQLTVYALICADIGSKLVYEIPYKKQPKGKKGNKRLMGYLFPAHDKIKTINIYGRIFLIDDILQQPFDKILINGEITSNYAGRVKGIYNRRSKFWEIILKGSVMIEGLNYCSSCDKDKRSKGCGQMKLCSKYSYNPKLKQMHFSQVKLEKEKQNILIKTKPTLK